MASTFVFKHKVDLGIISFTKTDQHLFVILLYFAFWLKQQTQASGYFLFNLAASLWIWTTKCYHIAYRV